MFRNVPEGWVRSVGVKVIGNRRFCEGGTCEYQVLSFTRVPFVPKFLEKMGW